MKLNKKLILDLNSTKNIIYFSVLIVVLSRIFMFLTYDILGLGTGSFIDDITRIFDNNWYRGVISEGYHLEPNGHAAHNAANWAFFPLDALCIRYVSIFLHLDIGVTGFLINSLFLALAFIVAFKYILLTRNNIVLAIELIFWLAFGPYTFYFSCLYTESLYIFLTFLSLYYLKKEKYLAMGITGVLLSATRNTGILFVFVIAYEVITKYWKESKSWKTTITCILKNNQLILGTALVPLGLFSYMAYLWYWMGDPLAFVRIQKAWYSASAKPIELFWNYFSSESTRDWYLMIVIFSSLFLCFYQIKKGRAAEVIVPLIIILIKMSSTYGSNPRYMLGTGTIAIAGLEYINENWSKNKKIIVFILALLLEVIFLKMWFAGDSLMV